MASEEVMVVRAGAGPLDGLSAFTVGQPIITPIVRWEFDDAILVGVMSLRRPPQLRGIFGCDFLHRANNGSFSFANADSLQSQEPIGAASQRRLAARPSSLPRSQQQLSPAVQCQKEV